VWNLKTWFERMVLWLLYRKGLKEIGYTWDRHDMRDRESEKSVFAFKGAERNAWKSVIKEDFSMEIGANRWISRRATWLLQLGTWIVRFGTWIARSFGAFPSRPNRLSPRRKSSLYASASASLSQSGMHYISSS